MPGPTDESVGVRAAESPRRRPRFFFSTFPRFLSSFNFAQHHYLGDVSRALRCLPSSSLSAYRKVFVMWPSALGWPDWLVLGDGIHKELARLCVVSFHYISGSSDTNDSA